MDFVASQLSGENNDDYDEDADNQRRNFFPDIASSVPSTSDRPSTSAGASTSSASSTASVISDKDLHSVLQTVLPLKAGTPAKKSNCGRKAMKSAVLTSPEVLSELREKAEKKREREEKRDNTPASKKRKVRGKSKEEDEEEDVDFCIICMKNMPKKMNRQNTIHCNVCDRAVHLKCAGMTASNWTCKHCISD